MSLLAAFCRWWTKSGLSCLMMSSSRYRVHNFSWKKYIDDDNNLELTLIHWPSWRAGLSLSKVHDFLGVGMDQNSSGHGRGGSVLAASWQVASLSTVMLLLDKVIPKQSSLSILSISFLLLTSLWRLQDGRSRRGRGWRLSVCTWHRCDTADMSAAAAHQHQNGYHPRARDSGSV